MSFVCGGQWRFETERIYFFPIIHLYVVVFTERIEKTMTIISNLLKRGAARGIDYRCP